MIREMLNGTIRAGLANIELNDLKEPGPDVKAVELAFRDSLEWKVLPDRLRIECTRYFSFEPECNFEMKITYFVEHYLKEEGSLEQLTGEEIKMKFQVTLNFIFKETRDSRRGCRYWRPRLHLHLGAPAITPPIFPFSQENSRV